MTLFFLIKTDYPIPMFQYGNSFTWEKYRYIILHPDLTRTVLSGLDKTYRKAGIIFGYSDSREVVLGKFFFSSLVSFFSRLFDFFSEYNR